jgi:hypothetical protein
MIRKPTRIELKQEDDYYEYEEFKKKQLEQAKLKMVGENAFKSTKLLGDKMYIPELAQNYKKNMPYQDLLNPYLGSRSDNRPDPSNFFPQTFMRSNEAGNTNTPQDTFNLEHMQDTLTNNFIFSVLLNNINQNEQVSFDGMNFNPNSFESDRHNSS